VLTNNYNIIALIQLEFKDIKPEEKWAVLLLLMQRNNKKQQRGEKELEL